MLFDNFLLRGCSLTTILDQIVAVQRQEVAQRKEKMPLSELERHIAAQPPPLDFAAALRADGVGIIAEVKRASPSRGPLRPDLDAGALVQAYAQGGAAAISVLTEAHFFQGSLEDLQIARTALGGGPALSVLRKDFLLDEYQVYEARAFGADAILLIVGILTDTELRALLTRGREVGMACLVEVHDEAELSRALLAGADIIGINNRNLRTFAVDLATTQRLAAQVRLWRQVPAGHLIVSESGISNRQHMAQLRAWGVNAALIGEALVTATDPEAKVRELLGQD